MKTISIGNFNEVTDSVKTEETISAQMMRYSQEMPEGYTYVSLPLAWNINQRGIHHAQKQIDEVCRTHADENLFFVCQHILVNRLSFHGNLVFTPHATVLDSFTPLPHYSCTYDQSFSRPWSERQYTFSFMGSFNTHPVRRKLYDQLKSRGDCLVRDTGPWHFESSPKKQQENAQKYIEILGNTKYSLCPRGTGPSTIRIWESMAMGSKPVILSDFLQMPLDREFHTSWIRMPENFDMSMLNGICTDETYDVDPYFQMFSNDNLYKSILREL